MKNNGKFKEFVRGTIAKLSHVCGGKAFYQILTSNHLYQLEIDSTEKEWETTYLFPEFKTVTLMRWIRKVGNRGFSTEGLF